jgi:plastocyanin
MAALVAAAPAAADVTITFPTGPAAGPYVQNDVSIAAGESVTWTGGFLNHPLVSDNGLWTDVADGGSFTHTYATAGTFPFHCRIHASMTGVVRVADASGGGGGGGGGTPTPTPQPGAPSIPVAPGQPIPTAPGATVDTTAPTAALATIATRAALKSGILVRFRSSEAGSASATLTAHKTTIGRAQTTYTAAGDHSLRVKLTKRGRSLVRRAKRLTATLRLVVSDAAGNGARLTRAVRLRA